jgi:CheY-like chemotaxis protein
LLTAVLGYAELIRQHPENVENVRRYAGIIENAGMDGAEIVRRVQQFAQQQTSSNFEAIDLLTIVRDAIDLTRPYWRDQADARNARITLSVDLGDGAIVSGVPSELREVVINLVRNAVDALPEGGTITISCRSINGEAVLEVADTGIGMEETTRKRVFEPFFTTKGPAMGLGLGLSVTWGIVIRHSGRITVDSMPGRGAAFRVTLPLSEASLPGNLPETALRGFAGARILLVDDEPMVLDSLSRILEQAGAVVHGASSGEEALERLGSEPALFDLVLSDHGMPGLTGLALLAAVRDRHPDVRRALISGWGASPPSDADLGPAEVVLGKPIARHALVTSLSSLMEKR